MITAERIKEAHAISESAIETWLENKGIKDEDLGAVRKVAVKSFDYLLCYGLNIDPNPTKAIANTIGAIWWSAFRIGYILGQKDAIK